MTFQITTVYPDGRKEVRDATPEEVAQREADIAAMEEQKAAEEAELARQQAAKESALAKLAAIGLTEEEAATIIK